MRCGSGLSGFCEGARRGLRIGFLSEHLNWTLLACLFDPFQVNKHTVESRLFPKQDVEGSNPFTRSTHRGSAPSGTLPTSPRPTVLQHCQLKTLDNALLLR